MKTKKKDIAWDHCVRVDPNNRLKVKCNYCAKVMSGGINRMKNHLAGTKKEVMMCPAVDEHVQKLFSDLLKGFQEKKSMAEDECFEIESDEDDVKVVGKMDSFARKRTQKTMNQTLKDREPMVHALCRLLYGEALPFNLVNSPLWKEALRLVGEYGKGLKLLTYHHDARVTYLKKEVLCVEKGLEKYKKEWKKTGCTIMSDGWTDGKQRSITNFLVNSPSGTVFVKSLDKSSLAKDAKKLFEMLDSLVEEVVEENVGQVITDSASAYVSAGRMLEAKRPQLFWSPCSTHLIDLILQDIGDSKTFKDTIEKAKKVTVYIYRHCVLLSMFRRFTGDKELTRAVVTRFATTFLTLKRFHELKTPIRSLFASNEWVESPFASTPKGIRVERIILTDENFWKAIKFCLTCVIPIYKVLRLMDGDLKPAMGYIYEAIDHAKEQIKENLNDVQARYQPIRNKIDLRWNMQIHRPLHAAGYYLNPSLHFEDSFNANREVKGGLFEVIRRMYDRPTMVKIHEQLEAFKESSRMFGCSAAIEMRKKMQPAKWWDNFGDDCPELQHLAISVLSLTCSAMGCERNWSTFDHIHSKKRNRLAQQQLNALVFVKYNINLNMRLQKRKDRGETHDPICLSDMDSDDEWITEKEDACLPEYISWMDVHEYFKEDEGTSSRKRKKGPRNLNKVPVGNSKRKGVSVDKDNNHELVDEDEEEDDETRLHETTIILDEDDDHFDPEI